MLYNGILLIKNITFKNALVKNAFQNYNIIQFFNEIYEKYILDINFMKNLILCIGHFVNSRFLSNVNIISSIKIIKTQLKPNLSVNILVQYVYILYNLSLYNDPKIYKALINYEIYKELMNIYPFNIEEKIKEEENVKRTKDLNDEDNNDIIEEKDIRKKYYKDLCLLILKLLGKMMSLEDNNFTQKLIDNDIAKFLNKVLQSNDIEIIKNAFFCLSNIVAGTYGQISNLYYNDTIFELIKVAKNVYDALDNDNKFINSIISKNFINAFREINYVISLIVINSLYEKLIPFVRYNNCAILLILLKELKIFNDNNNNNKELIIYLLRAISKLIDYDNKGDENDLNINEGITFKEFFEQHGFKEILETLQLNSDENIVDTAEAIYDSLYEDNINDNNVNIDDIINEKIKENESNENDDNGDEN